MVCILNCEGKSIFAIVLFRAMITPGPNLFSNKKAHYNPFNLGIPLIFKVI